MKEIQIDGPIKSDDGYGHMTENIILALDRMGIDVHCAANWSHTDLTLVNPKVKALTEKNRHGLPDVGVRISQPDSFNCLQNKYKVGFSMWEFTKLPQAWIKGSNNVDLMFVPSDFCAELWRTAGCTSPIIVIPLGVDTELFTFKDRSDIRRPYKFLLSGTLSARKNPDMAVEAFVKAFPDNDNVELLIKSPAHLPYTPSINDSRIIVMNESITKEAMRTLYHAADCFVYPTRSEGFGLSPCEAMSTGLPVICTEETGCAMYMKEEHSYPLTIERWEDVPSHWGDIGAYTKPSFEHLVGLMRYVYVEQEEAREKGRLAADFIRQNYTWDMTAELMIDTIELYNGEGVGL